jgi:hypothetical protein
MRTATVDSSLFPKRYLGPFLGGVRHLRQVLNLHAGACRSLLLRLMKLPRAIGSG